MSSSTVGIIVHSSNVLAQRFLLCVDRAIRLTTAVCHYAVCPRCGRSQRARLQGRACPCFLTLCVFCVLSLTRRTAVPLLSDALCVVCVLADNICDTCTLTPSKHTLSNPGGSNVDRIRGPNQLRDLSKPIIAIFYEPQRVK